MRKAHALAATASFSVRYSTMCSVFHAPMLTSSSVLPLSSCMKRIGGAPFVYVTFSVGNADACSSMNSPSAG